MVFGIFGWKEGGLSVLLFVVVFVVVVYNLDIDFLSTFSVSTTMSQTSDAVLNQILTQLEQLTISQQVLQAKVGSYTSLLVVCHVELTFSTLDSSMPSPPSRRHPSPSRPGRPRSQFQTGRALRP
jgi:hypothetical protein